MTIENAQAARLLERGDAAAERRLAQVNPFGCPVEIQRLGKGHHVLEVLEVHDAINALNMD
ncbi:hypothetical protein PQR57_04180 [Paraburkholderia dipogonis]|uniref:EAL domain-containing protein n=1 Tax=Paraburkholderia dipogonis TaxID=1211383 RepID=A0ABW9AIZ7_9BURK